MASPTIRFVQLTPPGRGAVATLRVEGPGAVAVVQSHFRARGGRPLSEFEADRLAVGHFGDPKGEEVVVRRDGNDAVELHCHGGQAVVAMMEETLAAAGCGRISWREWTAGRASDPIAVAALAALADAPTERCAAILLDQYHGALGRAVAEIRQAFAGGNAAWAKEQLDTLLARAPLGLHLTRPWSVVLAGKPNVGKSSLLNAIAGRRRAIVHPTPGTTRDAVTVTTALDGWPVELCDTAGLRDSDSAIERAGVALAQERIARADLVVLVFDQSQPWSADDRALVDKWPGAVLTHNKCDLSAEGKRPEGLSASAVRGDGIERLTSTIVERLIPDPPRPGEAVPFTRDFAERIKAMNGSEGGRP